MQLYNTLTRQKETFLPVHEGKVGMYACGITAYDLCHIGHARSAVVFDVLVRYLKYLGYEVNFIRNFTDVDDKIIARANKEGISCKDLAEKYIAAFHEDMDKLGVMRATVEPRATDHIQDMINLNSTLIEKGFAYATPHGDVYFRVRSFSTYGKLSGRSVDDLRSGARIAPGEEKEDPLDFALWKSAKPGEPFWESPWGNGRPGWHIECSAMSERYLPLPLDIHGGGLDLIFPHHENEIAQTEAATGKEFSKNWVHNGFVQINSEKMAKSRGNFTTIRDIYSLTDPEVLRFFLLTRQYRNPIDYSLEALYEAEKNLKRLYETLKTLELTLSKAPAKHFEETEILKKYSTQFDAFDAGWVQAMDDDTNTAAALGHMNGIFHLIHKIFEEKSLKKNAAATDLLKKIKNKLEIWGDVLGILRSSPTEFLDHLRKMRIKRNNVDVDRVEQLLQERQEARKNKDFEKADTTRASLTSMGIEVRDTPEGLVWDIT